MQFTVAVSPLPGKLIQLDGLYFSIFLLYFLFSCSHIKGPEMYKTFKNLQYFILFIPCIVNDLQILTVPTNAQCCYVFHS